MSWRESHLTGVVVGALGTLGALWLGGSTAGIAFLIGLIMGAILQGPYQGG